MVLLKTITILTLLCCNVAFPYNGSAIFAENNPLGRNNNLNLNSSNFSFYSIKADGINASFIPYGARLTHLHVNDRHGKSRDVIFGYDEGKGYINDTETVHSYSGAVVGRYANRVKNGTFRLNNKKYSLNTNENNGVDTIHGGKVGYDQRNWTVTSYNETSITFMLQDYDYEDFPGRVITYATYSVSGGTDGNSILTTRLVSLPLDGATPIMLSNHIYWSLNAFTDKNDLTIGNDTLSVPFSKRFIETDEYLVPNGQIGLVNERKGLDFTKARKIGENIDKANGVCGPKCKGIDTAFILDRPIDSGSISMDYPLLTMKSNRTGIQLDVKTNQRSFQIFSCNTQDGTIPLKQSQQHGNSTSYLQKYGCLVIEPQQWIDGINNPQWGQTEYQIFGPDTYPAISLAEYHFSTV